MSDIVKELLSRASDEAGIGWTPTTVIPVPARLLHHAADRIEQLEEANELMLTDIRRTDVDMLAFKARIEQLERVLDLFACDCEGKELCAKPDNCRNYAARAALGEEHT